MNNPELIAHLQQNYKKLLSYGLKFFRNKEDAEDCVQKTCAKLLSKDYGEIKNVKAFVNQALYYNFYNFSRDKRLSTFAPLEDVANLAGPDVVQEIRDHLEDQEQIAMIKDFLSILPKKQEEAVRTKKTQDVTFLSSTDKTHQR
jgi:RNA polymerase sigma factor (sigma-70 family)